MNKKNKEKNQPNKYEPDPEPYEVEHKTHKKQAARPVRAPQKRRPIKTEVEAKPDEIRPESPAWSDRDSAASDLDEECTKNGVGVIGQDVPSPKVPSHMFTVSPEAFLPCEGLSARDRWCAYHAFVLWKSTVKLEEKRTRNSNRIIADAIVRNQAWSQRMFALQTRISRTTTILNRQEIQEQLAELSHLTKIWFEIDYHAALDESQIRSLNGRLEKMRAFQDTLVDHLHSSHLQQKFFEAQCRSERARADELERECHRKRVQLANLYDEFVKQKTTIRKLGHALTKGGDAIAIATASDSEN